MKRRCLQGAIALMSILVLVWPQAVQALPLANALFNPVVSSSMRMAGKLTTHVLDTAHGKPAAGMTVSLWAVDSTTGQKTLLKTVTTNADGRTDEPMLAGDAFQRGTYELVFAVGPYFAQLAPRSPDSPAFLNQVPIQFGIADAEAHYHVPLLVSPWSYSTYRGS